MLFRSVYEQYRTSTGDTRPAVIVSTASPFKFSASVLGALKTDGKTHDDEFAMLDELAALTGAVCPPQLTGLKEKTVRFKGVCTKESMADAVLDMLEL